MASAQNNISDRLVIFRGDDTGGAFGRTLAFTIEAADGVSLEGCRAEWVFDGIVKTFAAPLIPGEVLEVFYSHNETRCMALGVRYGTFRIIDAAGKVRTFTNTKAVEVTDNVARCYPGSSAASVVVSGIGDMKHSEFADLEEKEGMTLNEVGGMVNTLIRKLKGTVSALAAILAFSALADGAITPDTDFGDIDPFAKLKAVVEASGAISGIDTNEVERIANRAVETNAVTAALASSVSSLQSSKLDKTNAYTKAETDEKLAGKADVSDDGFIDDRVMFIGKLESYGGAPTINVRDRILDGGDWFVNGDVQCDGGYSLKSKADKATPSTSGNLAALTADGNLADSGKTVDDFLAKDEDGQVEDAIFPDPYDGLKINPGGLGVMSFASWLRGGEWFDYTVTFLDAYYFRKITCGNIEVGNDGCGSADITPIISANNPTFSNAVMSVATGISTNDWSVIASVADWASVVPGGVPTGAGTLGAVLAALAATVLALKKKTSLLKSDGTAEDGFATDLLGKQVAIQKIDERLPIPISEKNASFTTESYKRFIMTVVDDMTLTLHTPMSNDAEIFECRFDGSGLTADKSISFSTSSGATATTMDANCGTVTAGKVALMSAFWNGTTWDVNWKVEG